MAFDKHYPNRKDWRKQYYDSRRFDKTCRNHGGCPYCERNRLHKRAKFADSIDSARELLKRVGMNKHHINGTIESLDHPHLDEWPKLIRAIHEEDPASAQSLAQSSIPPELFTIIPTVKNHQRLSVEVLEAGIASGDLQKAFLAAVSDGTVDEQDLDDIEIHYQRLANVAAQGMAAVDKLRK